MAIYDYACDACNLQWEEYHGMNEKPEVKCKECDGKARRLITTRIGIQFNGKGFYSTDSKK